MLWQQNATFPPVKPTSVSHAEATFNTAQILPPKTFLPAHVISSPATVMIGNE